MARQKRVEITEGQAILQIPTADKISKELEVFYNPDMKFNRDLTLLVLKAGKRKDLKAMDLMAGSGVRSIRLLKELPKEKIGELTINDANPNAIKLIEKNLKLNKIPKKAVKLTNKTADQILSERGAYDYIDVDPFGTPNPFLDMAVKKILPKGLLAVTATDTAPLCGTYPKACKRKYWATPKRDEQKHEWAARILIRKVQLIGAQYEKALIPICSIAKLHYLRVFFAVQRGKRKVDEVLKEHDMVNGAGPMWTGPLQKADLIQKMHDLAEEDNKKFLAILKEEAKIPTVGFIDLHKIAKETKIALPKYDLILKEIKKQKHKASRTIFSQEGIRTTIEKEKIKKIMRKLSH